jgi:hypothetical protein
VNDPVGPSADPGLRFLFDASIVYESEGAIIDSGDSRLMWGQGTGSVTGERLTGRLWWCNHARRNQAGVWHPDIHGFIRTEDEADILVDIEGYSVPNADDTEREFRCAVRFLTDHATYEWLNYLSAVAVGSFIPQSGEARFKAFEVVAG